MDTFELGRTLDAFLDGIRQVSACHLTALGMEAENQRRIHRGEAVAYGEEAFTKLIEDNYGKVVYRK